MKKFEHVHWPLLVFLGVVVTLGLSSCSSAPAYQGLMRELKRYPYPAAQQPQFWVTYYPAYLSTPATTTPELPVEEHGRAQPRLLAEVRALRDHHGAWTDDAMSHDLNAIQSAGFHGLLLMVCPQDLTTPTLFARMQHFKRLAASRGLQLKVGLGLFSETPLVMGSGNLAKFLVENGFVASAPSSRLPVVYDERSITMNRQNFDEERHFDFRALRRDGTFRPAGGLVYLCAGDSGSNPGITWRSQTSWRLPRGDGSFLKAGLRQAFAERRSIIVIHSWNRFADGSFIVPNTFDGNLLLDVIASEMDALETLRLNAAP